jgi:hypothetical protein
MCFGGPKAEDGRRAQESGMMFNYTPRQRSKARRWPGPRSDLSS